MNFYTLEQLVALARAGSRYYRELYKHVPDSGFELESLPVASFDSVIHTAHEDFRAALTSDHAYGMFYTTSGTTGKPKLTLFGRDEWRTINQVLANMHWKNGLLRDGDVICNLSEPGSASFMAVHRVTDLFPGRCSEIPVGCDHPYPHIIDIYRRFGATVITGMNPTFLGLAHTLLSRGETEPRIERILGGGELLYGAQRELIREAFPNAELSSFLYGTTEAGMVGYGRLEDPPEVIRVFDEVCRVEILDVKTNEVIRTPGRRGRAVITSFVRTAAPAIRLDTGDFAEWIDQPSARDARFSLHGRVFPTSLKVGRADISEHDAWRVIEAVGRAVPLLRLELQVHGSASEPTFEALVSLHRSDEPVETLHTLITDALRAAVPATADIPLRVKRVEFSEFVAKTRRKSRLIVDERKGVRV